MSATPAAPDHEATAFAPEREARSASDPEAAIAPGLLRPRQATLSIRWIVTIAAVALLTTSVLVVGWVNERNARYALTHEIETRLMLEARNLALSSTEALLTDFPELALHPLVKAMKARQPELALVLVLDHSGIIQGDPDARRLGTPFVVDRALEPLDTRLVLGNGEAFIGNAKVLVATAPVSHRNGQRIGTTMVGLNRDYLDRALAAARRQQAVALAVVLVLGALAALLLMSMVLRPVAALRAGIERIGRGDLRTPLRMRDRTELGMLADAVNDMAAALTRAQAEMLERERLAHEVELARQIQFSLLPNRTLAAGDFVIEGSQRAAAEVGGDYYDFFLLPGGKVGIAVADVAGKGLAGCLVMSMLSALLRAYRTSQESPARLLTVLDERLGETLQQGSFVTMFYGVLEPHSGVVTYASAGHSPVLVYRRRSASVEWFKSGGIPLGAVRGGAIERTLRDATLRLDPGDVLVQFTDGVNEAFDQARLSQFGFDRMAKVVENTATQGSAAVIAGLHRSVEEWTGQGPSMDDETILVVSREGKGAPAARSLKLVPRDADSEQSEGPPHEAEALAWLGEARRRGQSLRLAASLDSLVGIRDWLATLYPRGGISDNRYQLLSTALYEACANIVEHGGIVNPDQLIELWFIPSGALPTEPEGAAPGAGTTSQAAPGVGGAPHSLFLIRDHGIPFRADNWRETDFRDPKVWKRRRGFGLDIIHRVMSRVVYHPGTSEGNVTLMTFDSNDGDESRGRAS